MNKKELPAEEKKIKRRIRKLSRMCVLCYRNCVRLHFDSILLFKNGSYPTAYAISVIALEEMGKYNLLSHGLFYNYFEEGSGERFIDKVIDKLYDHKSKQKILMRDDLVDVFNEDYFALPEEIRNAFNKDFVDNRKNNTQSIQDGKWKKYFPNWNKLSQNIASLERNKHQSLYVGFPKKGKKIDLNQRLVSPFRFSRIKAEKQITYLNDYLLSDALKVLKGFSGLDFDELEDMMTPNYVTRLRRSWPIIGKKNMKNFKEWMRMPNDKG